jgi:cytochrome c-type biogenesis protein CcmE
MNALHKRRLYYLALFTIGLTLAAGLILYALKQNINAFVTPSEIASRRLTSNDHFRLGGMVKPGSLVRDKNNLQVNFIVTDLKRDLPVRYTGVLPDLFKEGKGVIAEGSLNAQGTFTATQILAKHDENYMPKNVYKTIQEGTK